MWDHLWRRLPYCQRLFDVGDLTVLQGHIDRKPECFDVNPGGICCQPLDTIAGMEKNDHLNGRAVHKYCKC